MIFHSKTPDIIITTVAVLGLAAPRVYVMS
jgi:hypothetical protein